MRSAFAVLLATLTASVSLADPSPEGVRQAANNASHELIECAAYYGIMAQGLRQTSGESFQNAATQYERLRDEAGAYAFAVAKTINQKPEAVQARLEMSLQKMTDEMGHDYVNASILMNKYAESCKIAMEDPAARLEYWMAKYGQ